MPRFWSALHSPTSTLRRIASPALEYWRCTDLLALFKPLWTCLRTFLFVLGGDIRDPLSGSVASPGCVMCTAKTTRVRRENCQSRAFLLHTKVSEGEKVTEKQKESEESFVLGGATISRGFGRESPTTAAPISFRPLPSSHDAVELHYFCCSGFDVHGQAGVAQLGRQPPHVGNAPS